MTHFMICDADTKFLDTLAITLHKYYNPCAIEYLCGPSALEVSLRTNSCSADILLTEIELRDKSAIDIISQYLSPSSPLQIIYMTRKMEYCTELYDTPHCGFLLKPIRREHLIRDINRALKISEEHKANRIVLQKNGALHIIKSPALLYLESRGRLMRVVTDSENLEVYEKIANINGLLDRRFLQCHKSYIINMERVRSFSGESFLLDNGAVVPISQSKRKEVRRVFLNYIGQFRHEYIL